MQKKIRVLQLGSPTGLYGAERWILALVNHLDPAKVDSWVTAIRDDFTLEAPLCVEADRLGIKNHTFQALGRFNFSAVTMLRKFIREHDIQIIHTHAYKQDIIGLAAVKGTDCKIVSTPHGWSQEGDFKLWCYEMFNRAIFPFFDAIVPLSEDLYRPLCYLPGLKKKLHLVRNGVDISEIDAEKSISPQMTQWKQEGAFIIGYIGQLIGRKKLEDLLDAVSSLPSSINWRLAIIGEGDKKEELQKITNEMEITDKVVFVGFRKDRLSFLKGFDCFVLPSQLEGIPRCLMEAMAAEVTVVATQIPGCTDLIDHGETGLLFPVGDAHALAASLKELAVDDHKRRTIATAGRNHVLKKFSANRMAREYEDIFFNL